MSKHQTIKESLKNQEMLQESILPSPPTMSIRRFRGKAGSKVKPVARYRLFDKNFDKNFDKDGKIEDIERVIISVLSDGNVEHEYSHSNDKPEPKDFLGKDFIEKIKSTMKNKKSLPQDHKDMLQWYDRTFFNDNLEIKDPE